MLLRSLLVRLGLAKAPTPIRTYLTASSLIGALPAAAFFGWKYRNEIGRYARKLDLGKYARKLPSVRARRMPQPQHSAAASQAV